MKSLYLALIFLFSLESYSSVTWKQQAERLQKISASLTESIPVTAPIKRNSLDLLFNISFLPTQNTMVGSKSENTDTPPVHSIPTIKYNFKINNDLYSSFWVGSLPKFLTSKLSQHSVDQYVAGVEFQLLLKNSFYLTYGHQLTSSKVTGNITSKEFIDELESISGAIYLGAGQNLDLFFWNINLGSRRNDSEFFIQEDDTTYKFSDQLEDSAIPLYVQISFGTTYKSFLISFSELYIPKRLFMPKLTLSYQW